MSDQEITELDEALEAAKSNPQHANLFYDSFLNTEIFVPALRADKRPGEWVKLSASDRFFPLYLTQGEVRAVPVFDRLERLKDWADDKAFDYLALPAYLFIKVIAPEIAVVLNEGMDGRYLFIPEVLEQLRSALRNVSQN